MRRPAARPSPDGPPQRRTLTRAAPRAFPAAADVNSLLRIYKDARSGRSWLVDAQGNNVTLRDSPVKFGALTIVPLRTALMGGGYFSSLEDALRLHPRLRSAYALWRRAGGLPGGAQDATLLAPGGRRA